MPSEWTAESVLALAPDASSAKAGQGLISRSKWTNLGSGEGLLWGECQGSGSSPYQTKVDPATPAFSCSCPSRKFPCKHAIGLMLIWAADPKTLAETATPPWVASWKENREKRVEKQKEKTERGPVDTVAQARRESARFTKVTSGLDDLSLWLSDLVRQGFSSLSSKPRSLWDDQARRMVDAQAPGVARRLRQIDEMSYTSDVRHVELLARLGQLQLLVEAFRRRADLPPPVLQDVHTTIGFATDLEAIKSGPSIRDRWQVIGQTTSLEEKLTTQRTWLVGIESKRAALVLDYAASGKPLDLSLPAGIVLDADLAFVPGAFPLRALVTQRHSEPAAFRSLTGGTSIARAFEAHGRALSQNPWLELTPVILDDVYIEEAEGEWTARDVAGTVMPITRRGFRGWHVFALSGGAPVTLCGEFDGATLQPMRCLVDGRFLQVQTESTVSTESSTVAPPVESPLLVEATAAAIVGLDRKPPPQTDGDPALGKALAGIENYEPPTRVLAMAAAADLYGRVGRKPRTTSTPVAAVCADDRVPACNTEASQRLRRMLSGEHAECLAEWLELLRHSGRRLPHEALVEILSRNEQQKFPVESLVEVLDVRGRWLAAKNRKWTKAAGVEDEADPLTVWETGTKPERLAVLRKLRQVEPARARELVESTFAKDSAAERADFLAELSTGLSMDDEPFLEFSLDDRGKDVRRNAAELLGRLPESRFAYRMIERCQPLLAWTPNGNKNGTLMVRLPEACDKAMIRDGIEPKPPAYLKIGERAWWLREIVRSTPPATIASGLGIGPAELTTANQKGEWEHVLWTGWAYAAIQTQDADWAEALLATKPELSDSLDDPALTSGLLSVLSNLRRDAFLMRQLETNAGPLHWSHPTAPHVHELQGTLGLQVAREILSRVQLVLKDEVREFETPERRAKLYDRGGYLFDYQYHRNETYQMILELAGKLPTELADEAGRGVELVPPPRLYYASAYTNMIEGLQFRRDMRRELST